MTVTRDDGVNYTVTDVAADGYLDNVQEDELKLTVHGELVFLLNNTTTVAMVTADDSYATNSLIYFKAPIEQGATIKVSAVNTANNKVTKTHVVAASLLGTMPGTIAAAFNTLFTAESDMTCTSAGGVLQIQLSDGEYAQITAEADIDEHLIIALNGSVKSFEDLPKQAYHNCRIAVTPGDASEGEIVYMKAVPESYKDEETAIGPSTPVFPAASIASIPMAWWSHGQYEGPNSPGATKLAGAPTDDTKWHTYGYFDATNLVWGTYELDNLFLSKLDGNPGAGIILDDVYEYVWLDWINLLDPPGTYLEHHTLRFADPSTPQVTIGTHEVEDWGNTSGLPADWYNIGYWWNPYGASEAGYVHTVKDTISLWIDELGSPPPTSTTLVECKWIETVINDAQIDIDRSTMPHFLQPIDGSTFSYQAPNWDDRKAGDNTSNPLPPFISNNIEDIVIFQNRLMILTKDEVVGTETGNVFQWFRDTVTQVLSKHPVNVRSTSALSSRLRFFVYHNRDLLITTKRQQYKISGQQPLTPATASMQLTTSYNSSETVEPVSIGKSVFLPNHFGEYLNLNQYDGATQDLTPDSAANITKHVRKYITGDVNLLTGLPNHGLLFAASSTGQDIFVCNYDTDESRSESQRYAWFKWDDFSDDTGYIIRSIANVKNTLLVVIETTQGLNLLEFDVDAGADKKYIDYQVVATSVTTTVTLGTTYGINEANIVVVQGTGCPDPGDYATVDNLTAGVLTLTTSMTGGTVYVGREFQVEATPNMLTLRDEGGTVQSIANLRIQKWWLRLVNTGVIEATEQSPYDTYDTQEFSGIVTNSLDAITDTAVTTEDDFKVGFKQKADVGTLRIHTKSWLPMTISQIDWIGNYTSRGRRF